MQITEDLNFRKFILDRLAQRAGERTEGTHGSDLIYCLNKQALRKLRQPEPTEEEVLIWGLGWSTQHELTGSYEPDTEFELDGIVVTPDIIMEGLECPWELKATYQSSNRPIEENLHWIRQIMAQCKVTGTTVARLSRLEIMGDWKWVFGKKEEKAESKHPTLHAYKLEFTQDEIDRNWEWMLERKRLFEAILNGGFEDRRVLLPKIIALASGQDWECSFCSWRGNECPG